MKGLGARCISRGLRFAADTTAIGSKTRLAFWRGTPSDHPLSADASRSDHERRVSSGLIPRYRFGAAFESGSARGRGRPPNSGDVTSFLNNRASPHRRGIAPKVSAPSPDRPLGWRWSAVRATFACRPNSATVNHIVQPKDATPRSGNGAPVGCVISRTIGRLLGSGFITRT